MTLENFAMTHLPGGLVATKLRKSHVDRFVKLIFLQLGGDQPTGRGSSHNFIVSHIVRPTEKKNIAGNPLGKYKTTDAAGILDFHCIYPTIVSCRVAMSDLNNLFKTLVATKISFRLRA